MFNAFSQLLFKPALPDGVSFITHDEAKDYIEAGSVDLLLDVRSEMEWLKGRLPGAKLVPLENLSFHIDQLEEYKNRSVLIYCHTHNRSGKAAWMLNELGFENIKVLHGGISNWVKAGNRLDY